MGNHAYSLALAPTLLLASALLLMPPAFAQSRNIHESVDPYSGLKTLFLEASTRGCPDDPPVREHDPDVHLLFFANQNPDGTVSYFVTPELDRGNSLNVRSKGTMDTLIDGAVATFSTPMGSSVVTSYDAGRSYLHETVPFAVTQNDLATIAAAGSFQFRVNGPRQNVQRCTDAKHLRDLPEFLAAAAQYGPATGVAVMAPPHVNNTTAGDVKTLSMEGIATYACSGDPAPGPHDPLVQLSITAEQRPDHTVKYFIVTDLTHGSPLNLRNRGTLELEMGGLSQIFHTPHGSTLSTGTEADGHQFLLESIAFHVDRRDIVSLSKSPTLQFRIEGAGQTVRRCTDASHLQDLTKFIDSTSTLYDHPVADARHP